MKNPQSIKVLARHGKSFYWASLFLGSNLANKAACLYEFCRFVDDLADGDLPDRQERLEDIKMCLSQTSMETVPDHIPEIVSFLELSKVNNIPLAAARELLDGMLQDQHPTQIQTESELLRYCHAVAGTVGLMMCRVLDCSDKRADSYAIDLGIAMQLTNISRDVLEDARMGRRYIPANWFDTVLSAEDIATAGITSHAAVARTIDQLLVLAEKYYSSALIGIRLLPFRSRLSIAIALRVYRQIGWVLRRHKLAWWAGRTIVGKCEKVLLSVRSVTELIPYHVPKHQKQLHEHLSGLAGVSGN